MNRIKQLFKEKKDILSIYFTAGFPKLDDTMKVLTSLQEAGADLVEIGMPFSDPLADGETIQASSLVALHNGMSIKQLFEQIKDMRKTITMPVVLMGYYNPVFKYGLDKFLKDAQACGVDGVILPDLPFDEYVECHKEAFEAAGISNIFLITPQTSPERIRLIDENSNGFIYMVSSASVTGAKKEVSNTQEAYFKRVNDMHLNNPTVIGFGISNNETYKAACKSANGAIIGSAFVSLLSKSNNLDGDIKNFVKSVKYGE